MTAKVRNFIRYLMKFDYFCRNEKSCSLKQYYEERSKQNGC